MPISLTRPVPANFNDAHIDAQRYRDMYQQSLNDPDTFWAEMANEFLDWDHTWDTVVRYDFSKG